MKKRVNSFIMTILMVLTILPTNFITVGAESDCKIYLKVYNLEESVLDSKKFNVDVTNEDETIKYALQELETDEDTIRSQVYEYGHIGFSPNPDVKDTDQFFQAMVDIGYSEGNVDMKDYIDPTVFEDALNELLQEDPDNEVYLQLQAEDQATNQD